MENDKKKTAAKASATAIAALIKQHGEPCYVNEEGDFCGFGQAFWAGLHVAENPLIFSPEDGKFFAYAMASGLYSETSTDAIKQAISSRLLEASRELLQPGLERLRTDKTLSNIVAQLRGIAEKPRAFYQPKKFIHLTNGMIPVGGDEIDLVSFSPDFRSRNRCPFAFDEHAQCPRFENELLGPALLPEDIVVVQKYMGLSLGQYNRIQRALFLTGASASGKSQLSNIIQGLVGQENVTQLRPKFLEDRFEMYEYLQKTLLVGVDVSPDFLSCPQAASLKGLIGGDWLTAEQKFGTGRFNFRGTFCVVVTSNSQVNVRLQGDADAWHRRLLLVPFREVTPPKRIPDFGLELLKTEGAGILNWALRGLDLLQQDINKTGDIILTPRQQDLITGVLTQSDSLRGFLQARIERAPNSDLASAEIVTEYEKFCATKSWTPVPATDVQQQLEKLMLELFSTAKSHCVQRGGRDVRGYKGLKIK